VKVQLYRSKEICYCSGQTGPIFKCLDLRKVFHSVTSQVLSQSRTPNLKTKDVRNNLSGQGYRMSQGQVRDEHRGIIE
jgi:hypothetical protein